MPFITLFNIFPSLIKPYIPKCLVACGQALNTHLDKIIIFTEASFELDMYMLWLKFILGLMFFQLVSILFAIVPDYGNEYTTKENKN